MISPIWKEILLAKKKTKKKSDECSFIHPSSSFCLPFTDLPLPLQTEAPRTESFGKEPPTTGVSWISGSSLSTSSPRKRMDLIPIPLPSSLGSLGTSLPGFDTRCFGGSWTDSLTTRNVGCNSVGRTRGSQLSSSICPNSVPRTPRPDSAKSHGAGDHGRDFDVHIRLVVQVQVELQPMLQGFMRCLFKT